MDVDGYIRHLMRKKKMQERMKDAVGSHIYLPIKLDSVRNIKDEKKGSDY